MAVSSQSGVETPAFVNRSNSIANGYGVELFEFADGAQWSLDDIRAATWGEGTSGNNSVKGIGGYRDNVYGHADFADLPANRLLQAPTTWCSRRERTRAASREPMSPISARTNSFSSRSVAPARAKARRCVPHAT